MTVDKVLCVVRCVNLTSLILPEVTNEGYFALLFSHSIKSTHLQCLIGELFEAVIASILPISMSVSNDRLELHFF